MRVAALLSGGVDSSVALARACRAGHRVTAFYLKIWLEEELRFLGNCPWEEDLAFARATCARYGVPLEVVPLQQEYHREVVAHTLAELRRGHTPSPDLRCNRYIKLGAFADRWGGDYDCIVTGHYARRRRGPAGDLRGAAGRWQLLRGRDPVKDQTYFLAAITPSQLARVWFPLGDEPKSAVRDEAAALDLPSAGRPDSQGICFLGNVPYRAFVAAHLGEQEGPIRDWSSGVQVGTHHGHWFHTIGQRQGLGLGSGPWYVVAKEVADNTVWVSHDRDVTATDRLPLGRVVWRQRPSGQALSVRIRHGEALLPGRLAAGENGETGADQMTVVLDEPEPGVAPGQYAVLYEDEVCLGCGVIATGATGHGQAARGLSLSGAA